MEQALFTLAFYFYLLYNYQIHYPRKNPHINRRMETIGGRNGNTLGPIDMDSALVLARFLLRKNQNREAWKIRLRNGEGRSAEGENLHA
jgi:hypothetical protein